MLGHPAKFRNFSIIKKTEFVDALGMLRKKKSPVETRNNSKPEVWSGSPNLGHTTLFLGWIAILLGMILHFIFWMFYWNSEWRFSHPIHTLSGSLYFNFNFQVKSQIQNITQVPNKLLWMRWDRNNYSKVAHQICRTWALQCRVFNRFSFFLLFFLPFLNYVGDGMK